LGIFSKSNNYVAAPSIALPNDVLDEFRPEIAPRIKRYSAFIFSLRRLLGIFDKRQQKL
jgi:hypothetical protein